MTELSALNVKITGDADGLNAALNTAQRGVQTFQKSAESSAKVFERAFAQSEKSVDQLRRAIDPVYASSKRYESAVDTLDAALKQGTITQAAHARMLDQASATYLRAQNAAGAMGQRLGFLGSMTDQARGKIQQVGFQVQDFAVQVGAGTSATQAFAQQFPQLAGAFGPLGVALGTVAAILVPIAGYFLTAAANSDTLTAAAQRQKTAIEGLTQAAEALRLEREMVSSGASTVDEQRGLEELNRLTKERALLQQQVNSFQKAGRQAQAEEAKAKLYLLDLDIKIVEAKLRTLASEEQMAPAVERNKQAAENFKAVQDAIAAADISGPWNAAIGAIQRAINKQNEYRAAMAAAMGANGGAGPGRGASPGGPLVGSPDLAALQAGGGVMRPMPPVSAAAGGGGGGGGGGGASEIDSLRASLMTKEEVELESYTRRQEALKMALEQRMLTEDEFRKMSEDAQRQHAEKMTQIDVWRYGTALDKAGAFFGGMADAMQGGNERMAAIGKKFGAVEALINAWRAYNQTLADPSLPFFAKFAAGAKVLAAGMGAVNAIKGGGGGGGRSGGAVAANSTAAPQQQVQTFNFNIQNDPFGIGPRLARSMAEQLNEASRNGVSLRATVNNAA